MEEHPFRHEKLRIEDRSLISRNKIRGLDHYFNGNRKVRRKMIQFKFPNVSEDNEHKAVRIILIGLLDHPLYGTFATNMLSTEFCVTIYS